MTIGQTSPALVHRGTQEKRIMLTRREFDLIIMRFFDEVKDAKDYYGFRERIFDEAEAVEWKE